MFFYKCINGLLVQVGKDLDILLSIVIAYIQPELIESIRSGTVAIQPDIATLSLTKLLAISLGDQRTGKTEAFCIIAQSTVNKFGTCGHVAPLVITTKLQANAILLILIKEVVTLKQLIGKLGERQSVTSLTIQTLLHAILGHHIVYGDMLSHLTGKVEEGKILHPVIVVYQLCLVGLITIEVEEFRHLLLNCLLIMIESL